MWCHGITLSDIQQFQPQIDMMVRRLTESYTSQRANQYADLMGMTLRERIDYIASNSAMVNDNTIAGEVVASNVNAFVKSIQVADGVTFVQGVLPTFNITVW